MQNLWLIILVFFLILLILPIFVKINFSFDVLHNSGAISLYIYFIKIIAFKVKYENKNIVLITQKNKKDVELQVSEKQMRFLNQLNVQLKQKLILKDCTAISRIGVKDAMATALLTGLFNTIIGNLYARIKTVKKSANLRIINNPDYNGEHFAFCMYAHFSITLFDLIYSLIMSFVIVKRSEKYERI